VGNTTNYKIGAFGSSITEPSTSYAWLVNEWTKTHYPSKVVTFLNQAISGHWPWSNNIRYNAQLHTQISDIYLTDFRIVNTGRDDRALEALVRRIYTDNPRAVIVSPIIPEDADSNGVIDSLNALNTANATLAALYGVHLIDYRQYVLDRITAGDALSVWMADAIHPTVVGQAQIASMIESAILANGWLNGEDHSVLPARIYDDGEYENTPTRKLGTDYDSKTGWTISGSQISSSTNGHIVTYSATCSQFGLYDSSSGYVNPNVDISIDGGAYTTNQTLTHNGWYNTALSYGAHTISIRNRGSLVRIDEFWAI